MVMVITCHSMVTGTLPTMDCDRACIVYLIPGNPALVVVYALLLIQSRIFQL